MLHQQLRIAEIARRGSKEWLQGATHEPRRFVGLAPAEGESPQPTPMDPRFDRYQPIIVDTACFLYGQGCDEFEQDPSGQHFYDIQAGRLFKYKPINDVPLCHDPYYMAGRLGSTCHDEADDPDQGYRPIGDECVVDNGYSLSRGSYIENDAIVGSPCDPVGFCSNPNSNDSVVRDHCEDIWTDTEECPPGTTGVPPDCIPEDCPPDEPIICPDGSIPPPGGNCPPDELPGILPPENGEEPPENGEEPPENGDEGGNEGGNEGGEEAP